MGREGSTPEGGAAAGGRRERPVGWPALLAIGLVASALGIALGLAIEWFPPSASDQARHVDDLWDVLLVVSVPVFVLVETLVLYAVYKWRVRPGEEALDGPPIHGNTTLEVVWTAIPAVLLVSLVGYAYVVLTDVEEARADALVVHVTGEQFAWTYGYPGAGADGGELRSTELYLPRGRQVAFRIDSKDVIHDFWVPAFRMKVDAVPGVTTGYRVDPRTVGTYPVVCAELCGLGHAAMRSTVRVVEPARFEAWLARERRRAAEAQEGA